MADEDLLAWEEIEDGDVSLTWAKPQALPRDMKETFAAKYRKHILSFEKVVLDLHSGRILGNYGIYVMDAAAVIMLFLAISGSSIWIIQNRKKRQHKRKQRT